MAACDYAELILKSYRRLVLEELTFTVNEQKLKRVSNLIRDRGEVPHRDVLSGTRYNSNELKQLIQTLVEMGRIEAVKGSKGGRIWRWIGQEMC